MVILLTHTCLTRPQWATGIDMHAYYISLKQSLSYLFILTGNQEVPRYHWDITYTSEPQVKLNLVKFDLLITYIRNAQSFLAVVFKLNTDRGFDIDNLRAEFEAIGFLKLMLWTVEFSDIGVKMSFGVYLLLQSPVVFDKWTLRIIYISTCRRILTHTFDWCPQPMYW